MRPKIVFMDLEGTLYRIPPSASTSRVAQSAWTTLAARLGEACLAEEEASKVKWETGGFGSYLQWMEVSLEILKRHGLSRPLFASVMADLQEVSGIRESGRLLTDMGARMAIVSGGFKALADRAVLAMRAHHAFAACDLFFDDETGRLEQWNLLPTDYMGKVDFMRLLIREYDVDAADCVFVGDGVNDVYLCREVGMSVAVCAQEELVQEATYSVGVYGGTYDFRDVVKIIQDH